MTINSPILAPVIALVAWSLLMLIWLYLTRIPAIRAAEMRLDPQAVKGEQMAQLPAKVRWKADNYNHLMEQPTLFYALALSLALLGAGEGLNLALAWAYVGLRVAHSLVQALINIIEVRFVVFILASLVLITLAIRAVQLLIERGLI